MGVYEARVSPFLLKSGEIIYWQNLRVIEIVFLPAVSRCLAAWPWKSCDCCWGQKALLYRLAASFWTLLTLQISLSVLWNASYNRKRKKKKQKQKTKFPRNNNNNKKMSNQISSNSPISIAGVLPSQLSGKALDNLQLLYRRKGELSCVVLLALQLTLWMCVSMQSCWHSYS